MVRFFTRITFIAGFFIGLFLGVLIMSKNTNKDNTPRLFNFRIYLNWFKEKNLSHKNLSFDTIRYSNKSVPLESEFLKKQVNVLCLILVKTPKNAKASQNTWGKSCNEIQLINLNNRKKNLFAMPKLEDSSWSLLCKTLKQIPKDKHDWILIVYDYTFVVVENLRLFVAGLNPDDKYYLGHAVKLWGVNYNMGQAGYVLSRGSLKSLQEKLNITDTCVTIRMYRNQEDYYLGKHFRDLNITVSDTRDSNGFSTFHPYNLNHALFPDDRYYRFSVHPYKCCSRYTIAFQSIEGDKMYTYSYLLYKLQLYHEGNLGNKPPPQAVSDEEIWKTFLRNRNLSTNISAEQYYKVWENLVDDPTSFAKHMKQEKYVDYN